MTVSAPDEKSNSWLDRPLFSNGISLSAWTWNWETITFCVILLLAVLTRLYLLEPRVMSHDENSHVYYSWLLYKGNGYSHDPVTHGPFQFHLVALSYFFFGDNDTSARIPAALFGIATVALMWNFRRYLGRAGALIAGLLLVISPYMLYYARYVRNEAFVALWGVMMLWATLRYLETGIPRYMALLVAVVVLHFCTKETSYIYAAQLLLFLGLVFLLRRFNFKRWANPGMAPRFIWSLAAAGGLLALGALLMVADKRLGAQTGLETAAVVAEQASGYDKGLPNLLPVLIIGLGAVAFLAAFYFLVVGQVKPDTDPMVISNFLLSLIAVPIFLATTYLYARYGIPLFEQNLINASANPDPANTVNRFMSGLYAVLLLLPSVLTGVGLFFAGRTLIQLPRAIWKPQADERAFDLIVVLLTLLLPTLAAFFIKTYSNPIDYTMPGMVKSGLALIPFTLLALGIGLGWERRLWLPNMALFYSIFIVFYTTFFTNGSGFFTGMIGSLGYWLEQQGVNRGDQPWYYYVGLQVPFYEFLPALGLLAAVVLLIFRRSAMLQHQQAIASEFTETEPTPLQPSTPISERPAGETLLPPLLFVFWSITSALAYTAAGEKMPWLTVHIALPLILTSGWALGYLVNSVDWRSFFSQRGALLAATLVVGGLSFLGALASVLGGHPPFQGQELSQLQATTTFIVAVFVSLTSLWVAIALLKDEIGREAAQLGSILAPVVIASMLITLGSLFGPTPPFAGVESTQVRATTTFVIMLALTLGAVFLLLYTLQRINLTAVVGLASLLVSGALVIFGVKWLVVYTLGLVGIAAGIILLLYQVLSGLTRQLGQVLLVLGFVVLAAITTRSAFLASYINYDRATEYLVYAHCATGIKEALSQIEEISRRTTGSLDVMVAFDDSTTYPYWWYLRNYPNQNYFGAAPTRDLRDSPLILAGEKNYAKLEPILRTNFYEFDYVRIWWPNMDYFNLTGERIRNAIANPDMRAALFDVWFYRDYTEYARLTGTNLSLKNWSPAERMKLYVRKDIAEQVWNFGSTPAEVVADPYEGKEVDLSADLIFGTPGSQEGELFSPHGIAVAADGSLYIADSGNHRIQHISAQGVLLNTWGGYANAAEGAAPGGSFNEPWDVAVGPDGSVYVADTWNHRVQKFTAGGEFVKTWGYGIISDPNDPFGYYGPRGIAVDADGKVYVTDTGNKRVVVYDADGNYLSQVGEAGYDPGQFSEPVGVDVSSDGAIVVADTWNQRIQVISADTSGLHIPLFNWDVEAWYGKSLTNYPYLAVDDQTNIYVTDPEAARLIEFNIQGEIVRFWGTPGGGANQFNLPTGIAMDGQGGLWVTDSGNNRIMHFTLP